MTIAAPHRSTPRGARGPAAVWADVLALSRRSTVGAWRQPAGWMPGLFFPFMLAAVYSAQFSKAVDLPGFPFPDASFLEFVLVASVLQGVSFGSINGASALALDIENGFMDRLLSSPVSRSAILVGRLAGSVVFASMLTVILMLVFTAMGARVSDWPSAAVILVAAMLLALGLGALGCAIALRTGSQEVVQSIFPLLFVLIFVSSAFFPVSLMEGWYGEVAAKNPITWIIDPTRRLSIEGFDWGDTGQALGVGAAFAAFGLTVAFSQLRRRTAAT